jgi:nucleoid DNA-binding protein
VVGIQHENKILMLHRNSGREENMKRLLNRDDFITEIANRAKVTKGDIELILEIIISVFADVVRENAILKVRSFGKLYTQKIPKRAGRDGVVLPTTTRVIFKLAENIRYAEKRDREMME